MSKSTQSDEYKISVDDRSIVEGREISVYDDDRDETYCGEWIRDIIESRYHHPDGRLYIGQTEDNIQGSQSIYVEHDDLFQHISIFGATGKGKSTLLKNLMIQIAYMGHGFCYIDPKGEDISDLVRKLPEHRLDDIVWVDPGDVKRDKYVGFNLFETSFDKDDPYYDREVEEIVSEFTSILESAVPGWGSIMQTVSAEISDVLIRKPESYTIMDLGAIITSEEERKELADSVEGTRRKSYMKRLAEYEQDDFDALIRRIRQWERSSATERVIAQETASISITEAVEEGKIILVKGGGLSEDVKQLVFLTLIKRIWSSIRTRNERVEDPEPFFLCADEFNHIAGNKANDEMDTDIESMLSEARSMNLGMILATQQPSQLTDQAMSALGNTKTTLSFDPGRSEDAREIASSMDLSASDLEDLPDYHIAGQVTEGGQTAIVKTYPPYPPRRTEKEAEKVIDYSVDKYGSEPPDTENLEYGILGRRRRGDSSGEEEDDEKKILEAIYRAKVIHGTEMKETEDGETIDDLIHIDDIMEEASWVFENYSAVKTSNMLERLPDAYAESYSLDNDTYYKLKADGEKEVRVQDTGDAGTAGKIEHRELLNDAWEFFTKLRYKVELETQAGGEEVDGLVEPPLDRIMEDVDDVYSPTEKAEKIRERMKQNYEKIWELSQDKEMTIEAEKSTVNKGTQQIRNLAKATNQRKKCAFIVRENTDGRPFENARKIEKTLTDPEFVKKIRSNGDMVYYNDRGDVLCKGGEIPLLKTKSNVASHGTWVKKQGKVILEHPETGNAVSTFEKPEKIANGETSKKKYPYYTYTDNQTGEQVVVKREKGGEKEEGRYDNIDEVGDDGYIPISNPLVPEVKFNDRIPDKDEWLIIIMPDDSPDSEYTYPKLYKGDMEVEAIFDEDKDLERTEEDTLEEIEKDFESTDFDSDLDFVE